jgi:hypothetical protein
LSLQLHSIHDVLLFWVRHENYRLVR